jgi:capsular polysaccharide transport system permease protein
MAERLSNGLKLDPLFLLSVVVPLICAILYFGFFATGVYVSESKFVVRSPEKPAATGLGVILRSAGFANAGDEIFAAQSFAESRDALKAINQREAFRTAYTRPFISAFDRFNPLGITGSFEDLFRYYKGQVTLKNDASTSITTLSVRAYTAQDAHRFNEQLLQLSEQTVNRMNQRGRSDLVRYATAEVEAARRRAQQAAAALASFRNRSGIVDPEKQAEIQIQMISKLQDGLIAARSELAQLQALTPQNPRIPAVRTQIATLEREIGRELSQVTGGSRSLAANAAQYQRLFLDNQFAERQLAASQTSLEEARNDARRQQAYVERIVQPNLPDEPIEPRRLRGIIATLLLSLLAYGILTMLVAGIREHAQ